MKSVIVNSILSALLIVSFASEAKISKPSEPAKKTQKEEKLCTVDTGQDTVDVYITDHSYPNNNDKLGQEIIEKVNEYGSQAFYYPLETPKDMTPDHDFDNIQLSGGYTVTKVQDMVEVCNNGVCKLARVPSGQGGYPDKVVFYDMTISDRMNQAADVAGWMVAPR